MVWSSKGRMIAIGLAVITLVFSGCVTFRSSIEGAYESPPEKNCGAQKVKIMFIFAHLKQTVGYDAVPKLERFGPLGREFADIFNDAMGELTNMGSYLTFTEQAADVNDERRRARKDSLIAGSDFVIRLKFKRSNSFPKFFLGSLLSTVSLTLAPVPYSWTYVVEADVYDHEDVLIKSYQRKSRLTRWVQAACIVLQPFYNEKRVREELYLESLHDIFRQIETEKILVK